jgi:hypothetical protein
MRALANNLDTHLYDARALANKLNTHVYDLRQLATKLGISLYDLKTLVSVITANLYDIFAGAGYGAATRPWIIFDKKIEEPKIEVMEPNIEMQAAQAVVEPFPVSSGARLRYRIRENVRSELIVKFDEETFDILLELIDITEIVDLLDAAEVVQIISQRTRK